MNDIENTDSEMVEEPADESTDDDDSTTELTVDDYRRLEAEKEALEEKNRKLYARLNKKPSQPNKPLGQAVSPSWQEKIELKTDGYSEEEISFIQKNGGRKALDNPFVKSAIDAMREKNRAESAVVDVNSGGTDLERKYTNEQLSQMPLDELEKLLPKA